MAYGVLRMAVAALILAAVIAQLVRSVSRALAGSRDLVTSVVNFFSFFTVQSNIIGVVAFAAGAVWAWTGGRQRAEPRWLAVLLACATTCLIVTGIFYNLLLRGLQLEQGTTVPWTNETLHVIAPVFALVDLFVGQRRRALPWSAIGVILGYPILWVSFTLIRGPLTTAPLTGVVGWYPYPFLDPQVQGGYAGVAVYVSVIAVACIGIAALVVWVGRRRGEPSG